MLIKFLVFIVLYIVWVMAALALVFGVIFPDQTGIAAIILYMVIILIPVYLFTRWINGKPGWTNTVLADGKQASATIVSVKDAGFSINRRRFYKIKLRVQPRDEEPFEVTQEKGLSYFSFPSEGETVSVKYDPNNHKHLVILSDAGVSPTTSSYRSPVTLDPELQELMRAEAASRGEGSTSATNVSEELSKLAQLHKSGDLTDAEFASAKKKLLG